MVAPGANSSSGCHSCPSHAQPTVPLSISAPHAQSPTSVTPAPRHPSTASQPHLPTSPPAHLPRSSTPRYDPCIAGPQPNTEPLIFNPTPEERTWVIHCLCDPYQSLADVAINNDTSIRALTAWMAEPDVAAELREVESAGATKGRLCASREISTAVLALTKVMRSYTHAEDHVPLSPNTQAREQRRRHAETARRASWLLYRFLRYDPLSPAPSPSRARPGDALSPAPRGRDVAALRDREGAFETAPKPFAPLHEVQDRLTDLLLRAEHQRQLSARPLPPAPPPGEQPRSPQATRRGELGEAEGATSSTTSPNPPSSARHGAPTSPESPLPHSTPRSSPAAPGHGTIQESEIPNPQSQFPPAPCRDTS